MGICGCFRARQERRRKTYFMKRRNTGILGELVTAQDSGSATLIPALNRMETVKKSATVIKPE